MKLLRFLFMYGICFGFFDLKSLYEKYEFYYELSNFLTDNIVVLRPVARLSAAAISSIAKGSVILKVPSSHIITTFDEFPLSNYFQNLNPDIIAPALLISLKMQNSSFVSQFIHQFPADYQGPSSWLDPDLMVYLSKFIEKPEKIDSSLPYFEDYKRITSKIKGLSQLWYDKKNFAWAEQLKRTHGIKITKGDWKVLKGEKLNKEDYDIKGYAFVPMFELYNQNLLPDIHYSEKYPLEFIPGYFVLRAGRDFKPGQEIYMPYEKKNNYQLFMDSGLNVAHSSLDKLMITHKKYLEPNQQGENAEESSELNFTREFYLSSRELSQEYLDLFSSDPKPLLKYRQGVRREILNFKFSLRHQRRRLKILDEMHIKLIFRLSISEKVASYHCLGIIDKELLRHLAKALKLI
jgi:hypothetical protein